MKEHGVVDSQAAVRLSVSSLPSLLAGHGGLSRRIAKATVLWEIGCWPTRNVIDLPTLSATLRAWRAITVGNPQNDMKSH